MFCFVFVFLLVWLMQNRIQWKSNSIFTMNFLTITAQICQLKKEWKKKNQTELSDVHHFYFVFDHRTKWQQRNTKKIVAIRCLSWLQCDSKLSTDRVILIFEYYFVDENEIFFVIFSQRTRRRLTWTMIDALFIASPEREYFNISCQLRLEPFAQEIFLLW